MKTVDFSPSVLSLLDATEKTCVALELKSVLLLTEQNYDFQNIQSRLSESRLTIASDIDAILEDAKEADLQTVKISSNPASRQNQLEQALLEALADELISSGETVACLYSSIDRDHIDTLTIISLTEQLSRLTARDLRRLETQVPLDTLRLVVDLAVDIGRDGREGKAVGALFVVGNHRKVLQHSHEQIHDPFKGYSRKECSLKSARTRESVKELAQVDGAFIISADGIVEAAGRILDAPSQGLTLSKGLGARHWAAAAVSKHTNAIAVAVSESTGTVRLFQDGKVVLRIEPMERAMKWQENEPAPEKSEG